MNPSIDLEAAQAAFLQSGGRIIELEAFRYVPLPPRKEPPKNKRRGAQLGARQMNYAARVAEISKAAETMTCPEVAERFGIPASTLNSMAIRENFSFVVSSRRRKTPYVNPDADAALAAEIRQCIADGMSRNKARTHMGISEGKLLRIIYEFSIDYPKKSQLAKREAERKLHPRAYYMGVDCRRSGGAKLASPFNAIIINGAWWLAGWNDRDMELSA